MTRADGAGGRAAVVFDVQRFCVHDGPGIRTVVFFKGCGLSCRWCHNPEAAEPRPQLMVHPTRCLPGCDDCLSRCPESALTLDEHGIVKVDWTRCTDCGDCVVACPAKALSMLGRSTSEAELYASIVADQAFFSSSGGGVTFSGGEPLLQAAMLRSLLPKLRAQGVHIAVETSGQWALSTVEDVLPMIDLVLFDLKLADPAAHRKWTGHDNARILANLRAVLQAGVPVELRMPLVPGVNTSPGAIAELAALVRALGQDELTLLPYNGWWEAKLRQLRTDKSPLGLVSPEGLEASVTRLFSLHGVAARVA